MADATEPDPDPAPDPAPDPDPTPDPGPPRAGTRWPRRARSTSAALAVALGASLAVTVIVVARQPDTERLVADAVAETEQAAQVDIDAAREVSYNVGRDEGRQEGHDDGYDEAQREATHGGEFGGFDETTGRSADGDVSAMVFEATFRAIWSTMTAEEQDEVCRGMETDPDRIADLYVDTLADRGTPAERDHILALLDELCGA